ncbi:hypothetical protein QYE76_056787 [Lolium multiflorum]|uniref:Uncharacterized protein n=1 Tax=Lolium multiflorum TaxID=4521 RepID=A0AAD8T424_LOLMU|nr:hypothetical protein QYE76_056787 [Lolium multiflorum]
MLAAATAREARPCMASPVVGVAEERAGLGVADAAEDVGFLVIVVAVKDKVGPGVDVSAKVVATAGASRANSPRSATTGCSTRLSAGRSHLAETSHPSSWSRCGVDATS